MNTLRISLVCGTSRIKHLIGLLTLLLLWPASASAACTPNGGELPNQLCYITSGTATYQFPDNEVDFHFIGNGFSVTGGFELTDPDNPNIQNPFLFSQPPGLFLFTYHINDDYLLHGTGDLSSTLFVTELTFNGVPQPLPGPSAVALAFDSYVPSITGAGTFSGTFAVGNFYYADTHGNVFGFVGNYNAAGTTTIDVVPWPGLPGRFQYTDETWTWRAPEPTALSLFALGLVGLAMRRKVIG
jgi:hypothetical protein